MMNFLEVSVSELGWSAAVLLASSLAVNLCVAFRFLASRRRRGRGRVWVAGKAVRRPPVRFFYYRMPFGKHRGVRLIDVPLSYCLWMERSGLLEQPHRSALRLHYEEMKKYF